MTKTAFNILVMGIITTELEQKELEMKLDKFLDSLGISYHEISVVKDNGTLEE